MTRTWLISCVTWLIYMCKHNSWRDSSIWEHTSQAHQISNLASKPRNSLFRTSCGNSSGRPWDPEISAGPYKTNSAYFRLILRCSKSIGSAPYAPGVAPRTQEIRLKTITTAKISNKFSRDTRTYQTRLHKSPRILIQVSTCVHEVPVSQQIYRANR